MVVQQRNEVRRNRTLCFLTIILAAASLAGVLSAYRDSSAAGQVVLITLGIVAIAAAVIAAVQLIGYPKRSQAILFHLEDRMVIAVNTQHEGYKLRFLRDILGDTVMNFTDSERVHWKALESDGFYPALYIRNPKKLLVLRLCTMVFDDVFVGDRSERWEHHDASNSSEPTFADRKMPELKAWKGSINKISA